MGEDQRIFVLDIYFQNTPTRWWVTHKVALRNWDEVKKSLVYSFYNREQLESKIQMDLHVVQLFSGGSDPRIHIQQCVAQWQAVKKLSHFWVQVFPHSLGPILKDWFIHEETK